MSGVCISKQYRGAILHPCTSWRASVCRFNYSQEFLQWALQPPGYQEDWILGVRVSSSGKLVAFITGVPATVRYSLLSLSAPTGPCVMHTESISTQQSRWEVPTIPCRLVLSHAQSMILERLHTCSCLHGKFEVLTKAGLKHCLNLQ